MCRNFSSLEQNSFFVLSKVLLLYGLTSAAHPCFAMDGNQDRIGLGSAEMRSVSAPNVASQYADLLVNAPGKSSDVFNYSVDASSAAAISQSRAGHRMIVEHLERRPDSEAMHPGSRNRLSSSQSEMSMLIVNQGGNNNAIQSVQNGLNNMARFDQADAYNTISGVQGGSSNTATVVQAGLHQTVVFTQSGVGSTLMVRQR
ncbi:MAG: hypothetical protein INR70_17030 [Parafilimonas terrae]|nr:hypothetical protein [Parafilimonas terrae]